MSVHIHKEYWDNGCIKQETHFLNGKWHCESGPAITSYHSSGIKRTEEWLLDGELHRLDGPAFREWDYKGRLIREGWFVGGISHREGLPAIIYYDRTGSAFLAKYYIKDKLHREDGPAIIRWNENRVTKTEYWLMGRRVSEHNLPLVKLLRKKRLYSKWKREELTSEDKLLIKMFME